VLAVSVPAGAAAQTGAARPAAEDPLPGLEAATGLFFAPSAYVQRDGDITVLAGDDRGGFGGALFGWRQRLEAGVTVGEPGSRSSDIHAAAKLSLLPEALTTPAVSAGILNAFGTGRQERSVYLVASKEIIPYFVEAVTGQRDVTVKLHAGYGGGIYANRPFVGAEIWGGQGMGVMAEVTAGRVSVGPRYTRSGFGVTLGLLDLKRVGGSVSYAIPLP